MGSTAGTAKNVVDELRGGGVKAGLVKLRIYRPFPFKELAGELAHLKALAVLDRADCVNGLGGQMFEETRSALYESEKKPHIINYVYGLGGRDIDVGDIKKVYTTLQEVASTGKVIQRVDYIGLRE